MEGDEIGCIEKPEILFSEGPDRGACTSTCASPERDHCLHAKASVKHSAAPKQAAPAAAAIIPGIPPVSPLKAGRPDRLIVRKLTRAPERPFAFSLMP